MTTIDVWLCHNCKDVSPAYNFTSDSHCRWCGKAIPDVTIFEQIPFNSPAALELLDSQSKTPQIAPKQGKSAQKGKASADGKESGKKKLENDFISSWDNIGLNIPFVPQYAVKSKRYLTPKTLKPKTFKLDFAIPSLLFCVEIQGGTYRNGAHSRGAGYHKDRQRVRELQYMGWVVFEFTTDDLQKNTLWQTIEEVRDMVSLLQAQQKKGRAA